MINLSRKKHPLTVDLDSSNNISNIIIYISGLKVNFLERILEKSNSLVKGHEDSITTFDKSYSFYLIQDTISYVLGVSIMDDKNIIILKYSFSGILVNKISDEYVEGGIVRTIGNQSIHVDNNKTVTTIRSNVNLLNLKKI